MEATQWKGSQQAFPLLNNMNEFKLIFNYWNEGIKTNYLICLRLEYFSDPDSKSSDTDFKAFNTDTILPWLKTNCTYCSSHG